MDIVLKTFSVDAALECLLQLLLLRSRRFIVRGATKEAFEFIYKGRLYYRDHFEFEFILCDTSDEVLGAVDGVIHPSEAYKQRCDAVFIFAKSVDDILKEIESLDMPLPHVVYHATAPKNILFLSLPKCGTHIMLNLINALPLAPGCIEHGDDWRKKLGDLAEGGWLLRHFILETPPDVIEKMIESEELTIIFSFRDPRGQLLSMVNFLSDSKFEHWHTVRDPGNRDRFIKYSSLPDTRSRLIARINEPASHKNIHYQAHSYLLRNPKVCTVRYENLIGPQGGGNSVAQIKEIRKVMRRLRVSGDAKLIAEKLFDPNSATFYKGLSTAWKEHFTGEIMELFKKSYPDDILRTYGYEE